MTNPMQSMYHYKEQTTKKVLLNLDLLNSIFMKINKKFSFERQLKFKHIKIRHAVIVTLPQTFEIVPNVPLLQFISFFLTFWAHAFISQISTPTNHILFIIHNIIVTIYQKISRDSNPGLPILRRCPHVQFVHFSQMNCFYQCLCKSLQNDLLEKAGNDKKNKSIPGFVINC
jgi:hypothetical protein